MPPLSIDTCAALASADAMAQIARTLQHHAVAAANDLAVGALDSPGTVRLVNELAEELLLAARLVRRTAEDATVADALAMSLVDGVGAVPAELADPALVTRHLAAGESLAFGHFGFLPLWGATGVPSIDDVRQGGLGDCFLTAAIAAIALHDPEAIRSMITDHGNGTYTVHLSSGDVTVDDELPYIVDARPGPAYAHPGESPALWPAIIEKAVAVAAGGDYAAIDGLDALGNSFDHLAPEVGSIGMYRGPLSTTHLPAIRASADAGVPQVAVAQEGFGFGETHAWTVVAVSGAGAAAMVTLRNPWGVLGMERDEDGDVVVDADHVDTDGDDVIPGTDADDRLVFDASSPYVTMPVDVFLTQFVAVHTAG